MKVKKVIKQSELSSPENAALITTLHGDQVVQVVTENHAGETGIKVVMSQEFFVELLNSKTAMALPKEVMDKLRMFENMAKKAAKVAEIFQEDFKNKKP